MEARDSFGYWVRRRRKALDLTQEALAQQVGCALVTLRKIEADERRPSVQMAERLARCLTVPAPAWPEFVAAAVGKQTTDWLESPAATLVRLPGNLPAAVTSLIGREDELAAITGCLQRSDVRLLTLTGPVGVGKTRLAVEAGRRLDRTFRDGVFLVELASVRNPTLAPSALCATLGVREGRSRNLTHLVVEHLADRRILLLLDNFEHLLPAAPLLSTLLVECPNLRLLITSRARLHLYGEHEFVVAPLRLPAADDMVAAAESPAVRLFCVRAQAARADFRLTPSLTPVVVQICRQLDGLPLAIELAAARTRLFSPQELRQRLERRLPLATNGAVDLPPRLRVLENAIAWSYGLLTPLQRTLLARLAIFPGGFSLPAAEAICAVPVSAQGPATGRPVHLAPAEVADGIDALLDQSLLVREVSEAGPQLVAGGRAADQRQTEAAAADFAGSDPRVTPDGAAARRHCRQCPVQSLREVTATESRFSLLETIREFALDRLGDAGELTDMRQRHAAYFASWAEHAEIQLHGPDQVFWLACLGRNIDNLRAALSWLLDSGQTVLAARMTCALGAFWQRHGHYSEGRRWLDQVLAALAGLAVPATLRARTLQTAAVLAYRQGDWVEAQPWLDESLALFRAHDDRLGMAHVLFHLGWIAIDRAEWAAAVRLNQESLALARAAGDTLASYQALTNLAWTQLCTGQRDVAAPLFDEACALARQAGHTKGVAVSLANLAWIALYRGDMPGTVAPAQESLRLCCQLGEREVLAECLEILAIAADHGGAARRAAVLSGAADALWQALHISRPPTQHAAAAHAEAVAEMRKQLAPDDFAAAWRQGHDLRVDEVVVFALGCGRRAVG
jgi:predicted ATPase/DNA-binding XRE family transcriptional regulator